MRDALLLPEPCPCPGTLPTPAAVGAASSRLRCSMGLRGPGCPHRSRSCPHLAGHRAGRPQARSPPGKRRCNGLPGSSGFSPPVPGPGCEAGGREAPHGRCHRLAGGKHRELRERSVCTPRRRSRRPLPLPEPWGAAGRAFGGGARRGCAGGWVRLAAVGAAGAGPRALGARRPPARVSFPDGFPVFGCGARCGAARGGVRRCGGSCPGQEGAAPRCQPSPRGGGVCVGGRGPGLPVSGALRLLLAGSHPAASPSPRGWPHGVTCR